MPASVSEFSHILLIPLMGTSQCDIFYDREVCPVEIREENIKKSEVTKMLDTKNTEK